MASYVRMENNLMFDQDFENGFADIEENTVVYELYLAPLIGSCEENEDTYIKKYKAIYPKIQALAYNLSRHYIWHNQAFRLKFDKEGLSPISGRTCFGDSIDDEWFIVYILYNISKCFPDLFIRVFDADGLFLLIEAANELPADLVPENAQWQTFIHNGLLHILPHDDQLPTAFRNDLVDTRRFTGDNIGYRLRAVLRSVLHERFCEVSDETLASEKVQKSIMNRIAAFPQQIFRLQHRARCVLPAKLAAILVAAPDLVSQAVHSYCRRDPFDLQALAKPKFFPTNDLVVAPVIFSKHLYAKLLAQQSTSACSTWKLPRKTDKNFRAEEIGMKLTCGLEIWCHNAQKRQLAASSAAETPIPKEANWLDDADWKMFLETLDRVGYFQGEKPGQKAYDIYFQRAKLYFDNISIKTSNNDSFPAFLPFIENFPPIDVEALKQDMASVLAILGEDDDDWMTLTPDRLEAMLTAIDAGEAASSSGLSKSVPHNNGSVAPTLPTKGGSKQSPKPGPSVRPKEKKHTDSKQKTSQQKLDFNADNFEESKNRMLELRIPQSDSESSEMDSYGDECTLDYEDKSLSKNSRLANNLRICKERVNAKNSGVIAKNIKLQTPETPKASISPGADSIDLEDDDFTPVEIDRALVSNMLDCLPESHDGI